MHVRIVGLSEYIIFSRNVISRVVQVRVSVDDLEKERGAVLEEYRGSRNANGRMQDAHWVLMMEGSKVRPSFCWSSPHPPYLLILLCLNSQEDKG